MGPSTGPGIVCVPSTSTQTVSGLVFPNHPNFNYRLSTLWTLRLFCDSTSEGGGLGLGPVVGDGPVPRETLVAEYWGWGWEEIR